MCGRISLSRNEVVYLGVRDFPADLAERLELPGELLPGTGRLTLSGGRRALVEGQRGILEYTAERIVVSFGRESSASWGTARAFRP